MKLMAKTLTSLTLFQKVGIQSLDQDQFLKSNQVTLSKDCTYLLMGIF